MIWILVGVSLIVSATFVGTFVQTGNTWTAINAAGIVSAIATVVILIRLTRPPMDRKLRLWVLGLGAVMIIGTGIHWSIMYRMTHWQYDTLHTIHKVIFHGISMDRLRTHGLRTLDEYSRQTGPRKLTLGQVFRKHAQFEDSQMGLLETYTDGTLKIYAAVADSEVVLIAQATIRVDGESPAFENHDGQHGAVQERMRITRKGVVHELQN